MFALLARWLLWADPGGCRATPSRASAKRPIGPFISARMAQIESERIHILTVHYSVKIQIVDCRKERPIRPLCTALQDAARQSGIFTRKLGKLIYNKTLIIYFKVLKTNFLISQSQKFNLKTQKRSKPNFSKIIYSYHFWDFKNS